MRYLLWAIILLCWGPSAASENNGYTLDKAPWSNKKFEVCPTLGQNGLRAVIFEPEIEEWSYMLEVLPTVELKATENGVAEFIANNEKQFPAYFLKGQKIGYIDDKNIWVNKNGIKVTNFDKLNSVSGEKVQPNVKGSYEKYIYKANLEMENAAAIEKIHYEAPCTVFSVVHFDKLESETNYEFGSNNPYECDLEKSFKRSQKFNYTAKVSRPVVSRADGTQYYIKFPSGEIKTYGWTGIEHLYNQDGSLICDWNDLGQLIGYELIQSSE